MGFTDFPMCLSEKDSHPITNIHKPIEFPNSNKVFDQIPQSKQAPTSNYASQIPEFVVVKNRAQMNNQDQIPQSCNYASRIPEFDVKSRAQMNQDQIPQSCDYASRIPEFDVKNRAQMNQDQDQEEKNSGIFVSSLKGLDLPAAGEIIQDDDGCKTPTRMEFKIPQQIRPPPPPRKPMAAIFANAAAKRSRRRRLLLDYSNEIDSLFPPEIVADFGNKIKKVKIN